VSTGILTPVVFSYHSGHFRSSLKSKAVDNSGKPLPWYTYPAIDFLRQKDMADKSVLEFGAGQSTLWWAERAKSIVSFESNRSWYCHLLGQVPAKVRFLWTDGSASNMQSEISESKFDVIIVDGVNRLICAKMSISFLNESGAVIVDNSDCYWGPDGEYPIIEFFRTNGFSRVDFYGHAPGVILPSCTSLFFKDSCFLLSGSESPAKLVN
jgi:hypothetical protein